MNSVENNSLGTWAGYIALALLGVWAWGFSASAPVAVIAVHDTLSWIGIQLGNLLLNLLAIFFNLLVEALKGAAGWFGGKAPTTAPNLPLGR